jgi:predicted nucleic acid-binding protein
MIAAITASELLVGAHLASSPVRQAQRQRLVEEILVRFPPIPFDLAVARTYARLVAELRRRGVAIDAHDLQIGATATTWGHEVVTMNVDDFGRVPGLTVRRFS